MPAEREVKNARSVSPGVPEKPNLCTTISSQNHPGVCDIAPGQQRERFNAEDAKIFYESIYGAAAAARRPLSRQALQ
jgi:hypothetical protein